MMISTKGRYALRIVIDLAQNSGRGYISLKEISERQNISLKYLELIVANLNKTGIVKSMRGPTGGYCLANDPQNITAAQIIEATEGPLTPVSCLEADHPPCERADSCLTLPMWQGLGAVVRDYLSSITLADIVGGKVPNTVSCSAALLP